jgi:hypothetical protein
MEEKLSGVAPGGGARRGGANEADDHPDRPSRAVSRCLPELGKSLGSGLREFKRSITAEREEDSASSRPRLWGGSTPGARDAIGTDHGGGPVAFR